MSDRYQALQDAPLGGPCFEDDLAWHMSGGVAEGERNHDHVVEGTDHGDELGYQVDRREHPKSSEDDGELGAPWNSWIVRKALHGRCAGGQNSGEVLGRSGWKSAGEHDEEHPREDQHTEGDQQQPHHASELDPYHPAQNGPILRRAGRSTWLDSSCSIASLCLAHRW